MVINWSNMLHRKEHYALEIPFYIMKNNFKNISFIHTALVYLPKGFGYLSKGFVYLSKGCI